MKERENYLPHQQRVVDEKKELELRIADLEHFVNYNDIFNSLSEMNQRLLLMQLKTMKTYCDIIGARISLF